MPGDEGRILGIDPGRSRVGLALSDPLRISAQGLETYQRGRGSFLDHLGRIIASEHVVRIVLGYPLQMNGRAGEAAREAEQLAETLRERFALPVVLWDERLSSVAARRAFPPGSKKDWDRVAAVFILQSYLDSLAGKEKQ